VIILKPGILSICYEGVSREVGDSRIAILIGHEIAHLTNKDNIYNEALRDMQNFSDPKTRGQLKPDFKLPDNRTREFLADKKGTIYALMADFKVKTLFNENSSFFQYWAKQTGIGYSNDNATKHPSFEKRVQFVRSQLNAVIKQLELFNAGMLLFQVGSYHDSIAAFIEFSKVYPSREVFNNIGVCYLNLALDRIHLYYKDDYYRFRFSIPIDYSTTAQPLNPRGAGNYLNDKDILRYIENAIYYFNLAASRDPYNRACRLNLAAASILKKEYAQAMAECDKLLKKNPKDFDAMNNKAIAFYYYGQNEGMETTQKAIQLLETSNGLKPSNPVILYNLASMKEKRNRMAGAGLNWEMYLNLPDIPRDNFYSYIYRKIHRTEPPKNTELSTSVLFPQIPSGVKLGEDFTFIEKKFGKKSIDSYKIGKQDKNSNSSWAIDLQVIVKEGIRVVALDNTVEIIEKEFSNGEEITKIFEKYGAPVKVVPHTRGNFYIYKSKGFSVKEKDRKVVSYIWFSKGF